MEFRKAGYKVIVPWQKEAWCYHDTMCPDLRAYWGDYELFVQTYAAFSGFPFIEKTVDLHRNDMCREYACKEVRLWETLEELFDLGGGGGAELRTFFADPYLRKQVNRKEYQLIVLIDRLEEQNGSLMRFWTSDMTASYLLSKLQELKYMLKRIEWDASDGQEERLIQENYSKYAVMMACNQFVTYKNRIYDRLGEYLAD